MLTFAAALVMVLEGCLQNAASWGHGTSPQLWSSFSFSMFRFFPFKSRLFMALRLVLKGCLPKALGHPAKLKLCDRFIVASCTLHLLFLLENDGSQMTFWPNFWVPWIATKAIAQALSLTFCLGRRVALFVSGVIFLGSKSGSIH